MKFDKQKAREVCEKASFYLTGNKIDEDLKILVDQAALLPDALARIKELEDALSEERAQTIYYDPDNEGSRPTIGFFDISDDIQEGYKERARDQLHAEGIL